MVKEIVKNIKKCLQRVENICTPTSVTSGNINNLKEKHSDSVTRFLMWLNNEFDCNEIWLDKTMEMQSCWEKNRPPDQILDMTSILILRPSINTISHEENLIQSPNEIRKKECQDDKSEKSKVETKNMTLDAVQQVLHSDIERLISLAKQQVEKSRIEERFLLTNDFLEWIELNFECTSNWLVVMTQLLNGWENNESACDILSPSTILVIRKPLRSTVLGGDSVNSLPKEKRTRSSLGEHALNVTTQNTPKRIKVGSGSSDDHDCQVRVEETSLSAPLKSKSNAVIDPTLFLKKEIDSLVQHRSVAIFWKNEIEMRVKENRTKILVVLGENDNTLESFLNERPIDYDLSWACTRSTRNPKHIGIIDNPDTRKWYAKHKKETSLNASLQNYDTIVGELRELEKTFALGETEIRKIIDANQRILVVFCQKNEKFEALLKSKRIMYFTSACHTVIHGRNHAYLGLFDTPENRKWFFELQKKDEWKSLEKYGDF